MKAKQLLLFYNYKSSFIKKDIEILEKVYKITEHDFFASNKKLIPLRFIRQLFFLLRHLFSADVVVVQFAAYHSLLPSLLCKLVGKPCYVVVGGTDAHYFPVIGYGNWQKKFLKEATALTFKWCTHILPKHTTLMLCNYTYDTNEPAAQGIYARLPELKTPFTAIPNGFDAQKWQCTTSKEPNTFITVCGAWEYPFQQQLKGIDLILKVAKDFPDYKFKIVGVDTPTRISAKPDNVELIPPVSNNNLPALFSTCEFYMQLSMAEGFPNAICEAMLCECIPLGSDVFSIPEIIADSGFVLKHRDTTELKTLIIKAVESDKSTLSKKARLRIVENYTMEQRSIALLNAIENF